MNSRIDSYGTDVAHGWTREADGTVWYWSLDGGEVEFTDRGTPTDHPIRSGNVPDDVRTAAEACAEHEVDR